MTGNRDRFGELIEEDDLTTSSFCQDELVPTRRPPTRDEIHRDQQEGEDRMTDTTEDLHHAPKCPRPGVAHERGYSVTVTRCLGCGAVATTRNGTQSTSERSDQ